MLLLILVGVPIAFGEDYSISSTEINEFVKVGDFKEVVVSIPNEQASDVSVQFDFSGDVRQVAKVAETSVTIGPDETYDSVVTLFGENLSVFEGSFLVSGTIEKEIAMTVNVVEEVIDPVEALAIEIEPITERAKIGDVFEYRIGLQNLLTDKQYNVTVSHSIDKLADEGSYKFEKSFFTQTEVVELSTATSLVKEFDMPEFIRPGEYVINVKAEFFGLEASSSRRFRVVEVFWDFLILGIFPVRWVILVGTVLLAAISGVLVYIKVKASKKRYVMKIDYNLLPKPGPRSAWVGFIAETTKKAFFDIDQLTTHCLVAGSTGGGKTVSVEVIVEEALMKGVSVIVFDPTAQWTGFLRKNTQKRMFDIYPRFNMKKTDARAFNGNIRQILNPREVIEFKRYMKPGEINVFSIARLDPKDADIIVANTIRQVFHANLPESPNLKTLIIFDEVHRLLPKFGGSGEGFIQIERGAREFRKWGVGLVLISQVLTDFVGETKANINTEIQMRTRNPADLDRIKNKYGSYMLQSLLKSATGTGMMENTSYNKGNPYFIAFRPLVHEHARLPDDELENYNKYNDIIDDLEYQLEQLEKEEVDTFELKLELKLSLDKVKTGNFNMVDVYLDGLKPMIKKQWDKLGKKPQKKKVQLVSEDDLKKELEAAKASRQKAEKESKDKGGGDAGGGGGGQKILNLANGIMVTKKNELLDALEAMDDETFGKHVDDKKNELADWLKGEDPNTAEVIAKTKTREEMIAALKKEWDVE